MTALVQIMAWRRRGDKPLSEPMMVSLPTLIWVTRPQWVKNGILERTSYISKRDQCMNNNSSSRWQNTPVDHQWKTGSLCAKLILNKLRCWFWIASQNTFRPKMKIFFFFFFFFFFEGGGVIAYTIWQMDTDRCIKPFQNMSHLKTGV